MQYDNELLDQIKLAQEATSVGELTAHLESIAKAVGFEYFAFGLRKPFPISAPHTELFNNYPLQWQDRYSKNGYLSIDPTVQHGLISTQPLIWNDELFIDTRPLMEEAKSYGLAYGWAQSCRDAQGNIGMLSLARSEELLSDRELLEITPYLSWLTQLSHSCFLKFSGVINSELSLTLREREVLRWTAEGKTSWEISVILSVSERTVNFHINNAVNKLNVSNKTAAVVKAVLGGLLW